MLSKYRNLGMPMAGRLQRQYTIVRLPESQFTASAFLLKIFERLCFFCLFLFDPVFLFCFFFSCESTYYVKQKKKKKKKKKKKLQTSRTNTLLRRSF